MAFALLGTPAITSDKVSGGPNEVVVERTWQASFTGRYSGPAAYAACVTAGLPAAGSTLTVGTATAYITNFETNIVDDSVIDGTTDSPGVIEHTASFSTANEFLASATSPLDRPPIVSWGGTDRTEVAIDDQDGNRIENSAGDEYDPLPERPVEGGAECSIQFNTATNPATWCTTLSNTVNSAAFHGVAAGNAMIGVIQGQQQIELVAGSSLTYWQVTVPIRFNNKGWRFKPIDNGYRYFNDDGDLVYEVDKQGSRGGLPVLLDGDGNKLSDGSDPVVYPTGGYKIIKETSWTGLPLPNPFA